MKQNETIKKYYQKKENVVRLERILCATSKLVQAMPKQYFPELELGVEK